MPELTVDQAFQLALSHHQAGRIQEAAGIYRQIIASQPDHYDALHLLGMTEFQQGRADQALGLVQRAIKLRPNVPIFHNNLGQTLERLGRREEATVEYRRALALDPNYPEANNNIGNMHERADRMAEAIASYRKAIRLKPDYAEAHTNLGNVFKEQGSLDEAIACYREAVARRPDVALLHSNLLLALHYHRDYSAADLLREHRVWAQRHAAPLAALRRPHSNTRDPDRRLRIGYVSADLREHAIPRFLRPILQQHDRRAFEIYAYADVAKPDAITARLKTLFDVWRDVTWFDDTQIAELVRRDQIDVLVDLSAHTAGARLLVFARKPAPVQVTYLAYCSTTGLDTIDYRISDPHLDPTGRNLSDYSEATHRLPETYWCYSAPDVDAPLPEPAPRVAGPITFGCLNNFCKVTETTLVTWARLLQAVPDSTLLIHARAGSHRQHVCDVLRPHGIESKRIRFVGKQPFADYLATYREIDIALDPFPFAGGTTTCDALWMGVPVVTLAGRTAVARGGVSILNNLGLPELIAETEADYLRIATALATDTPRLARLRTELRGRLQSSPLMDAPRFTRHLEGAFRTMWRHWCNQPPT